MEKSSTTLALTAVSYVGTRKLKPCSNWHSAFYNGKTFTIQVIGSFYPFMGKLKSFTRFFFATGKLKP